MLSSNDKYLKVGEVAPLLKMSEQAVYRAIRENQFPFRVLRIGKQLRIQLRVDEVKSGEFKVA